MRTESTANQQDSARSAPNPCRRHAVTAPAPAVTAPCCRRRCSGSANSMSAALALAFLENVTAQRDADGVSQSFDTTALSRLHSIEVPAPGRLTAVLPITPEVQNRYGTLHGGCIGDWRRGLRGRHKGAACRPSMPLSVSAEHELT